MTLAHVIYACTLFRLEIEMHAREGNGRCFRSLSKGVKAHKRYDCWPFYHSLIILFRTHRPIRKNNGSRVPVCQTAWCEGQFSVRGDWCESTGRNEGSDPHDSGRKRRPRTGKQGGPPSAFEKTRHGCPAESASSSAIGAAPAIGRSTEIAPLHPSGSLSGRPVLRLSRVSPAVPLPSWWFQWTLMLSWVEAIKAKKNHTGLFFFFSKITVVRFGTTPGFERGGGGGGDLFTCRSPESRLQWLRSPCAYLLKIGGGGGGGSMKYCTRFVLVHGRRCA